MIHIYYHRSDLDGHCSGAILRDMVETLEEQKRYLDFDLYPFNYGDDFDLEAIAPSDTVYMVDMSLPPDKMQALNNKLRAGGGEFIWIDHHKTAIDACADLNITGLRVVGKAACLLTWEYVNPLTEAPSFVKLLSDYDVWNNTNADYWENEVLPFQYGLRGNTDPSENQEVWSALLFHWVDTSECAAVEDIKSRGRIILEYQARQDAIYCKSFAYNAFIDTPERSYRALVVNKGMMNSRAFNEVVDANKHDVMLAYAAKGPNEVKCSIYAVCPVIDVSKIASYFGGGGHKGAAGFTVKDISSVLS